MKALFLIITFGAFNAQAQHIPIEFMARHLVKAGELSPVSKWQEATKKISLVTIFKAEDQSLYCFSTTYAHYYNFFLLQKEDTFRILNCNDFIEDYEVMDSFFSGNAEDSFAAVLPLIIQIYRHNYNYHPTPPMPTLNVSKTEKRKVYYIPRILPTTAPFVFPRKKELR